MHGRPGPAGAPRARRPPLFALVVLGSIAAVAMTGAVRALGRGEVLEAVGPLLAVAFAVFAFVRIVARRRP